MHFSLVAVFYAAVAANVLLAARTQPPTEVREEALRALILPGNQVPPSRNLAAATPPPSKPY